MAYHADNALPSHSEGERVLPMQKGGKQRLKKSDIWVTGSFDVPFLALSLLLLTIGLVMLCLYQPPADFCSCGPGGDVYSIQVEL